MEKVSLEVVGALGGASRQAVSKAGNPLRWLQARLRRSLFPKTPGPGGSERAYRVARAAMLPVVTAAAKRLAALRGAAQKGRPQQRSSRGLALLLRVPPGGELLEVFARWVRQQVQRIRDEAPARAIRGWRLTRSWLDQDWLPRWARRRVGAFGSAKKKPNWPLFPEMFRGLL